MLTELLFYGPKMRSSEWCLHTDMAWTWPGDAVTAATKMMRFDKMQPVSCAELEVVWIPYERAYLNLMVVDYVSGGVPHNPVGIAQPTSPDGTTPVTARQDITADFNSFITNNAGQKYLAWQLHGRLLLAKAAIYLWS